MATARPKTADGLVEGIRMLRIVRRSAIKARTQAINQLHALGHREQVKHQLRGLSTKARIGAYHHHGCAIWALHHRVDKGSRWGWFGPGSTEAATAKLLIGTGWAGFGGVGRGGGRCTV